MSGKNNIVNTCKKMGLEVKYLEFDKGASPTPSGYARGGSWDLTVTLDDEEACFAGSAKEIVDELNDSFCEL